MTTLLVRSAPATAARRTTQRLLTCSDVAALPLRLPTGDVRYELDDGELIVMPPPGDTHGAIQSNLVTELKVGGERVDHGRARSEVGIILWRDPDRLVGADVAFIANRSLPLIVSSEGYLETIPELVGEVRSKNDSDDEVNEKVADYLTAGVRVVWVLDPATTCVIEHRPDQPPRVFGKDEDLTVEDVIPGFRVLVADLFRV